MRDPLSGKSKPGGCCKVAGAQHRDGRLEKGELPECSKPWGASSPGGKLRCSLISIAFLGQSSPSHVGAESSLMNVKKGADVLGGGNLGLVPAQPTSVVVGKVSPFAFASWRQLSGAVSAMSEVLRDT